MRPESFFLIRNAGPADLAGVMKLARHLNSYNLPAEKGRLKKLLEASRRSFSGAEKRDENKRFLFLAVDARTGAAAGCSLIIARHGTPRLPHLAFKLGREKRKSLSLKKTVEHVTLELSSDTHGFTEIGGLCVLPAYRGLHAQLGKQLSYTRFAYIAGRRAQFRRKLLVEYLPKLDPKSGNALWTALGQKFTGVPYHAADLLSAETKEFVLSLFPREKIYAALLPDQAQRLLGAPGDGAKASLKMLSRIGFRFLSQIDPFDGGPHYGADVSDVSIIRNTVIARSREAAMGKTSSGGFSSERQDGLVLVEKNGNIRACRSVFAQKSGSIFLPRQTFTLLKLRRGDRVSVTPF